MSRRPASDLKFCSCRMCRYGRRRGWGSFIVKYSRRSYRRKVKRLLRAGVYDIPNRYAVPYTD